MTLNPLSPSWFLKYLSTPISFNSLTVDGGEISYQRWSNSAKPIQDDLEDGVEDDSKSISAIRVNKPGLLFVHGYGAHAHWWDFIAPAFLDHYDVIAMDMSGAGESSHRSIYTATTFAEEIRGVCRDAKLRSPVIVGHSFGGAMTRIAAHLYGDEFKGIVIVDSAISRHISSKRGQRPVAASPRTRVRTRMRHYQSITDGARRFRLRPPQPCENKFIVDHIAKHSLANSDQGFYFKLDQALFSKLQEDPDTDLPAAATMVANCPCQVGFIYGEKSRFFDDEAISTLNELIEPELLHRIPQAYHHVFLDQPKAFIDSLAQILKAMNSKNSL